MQKLRLVTGLFVFDLVHEQLGCSLIIFRTPYIRIMNNAYQYTLADGITTGILTAKGFVWAQAGIIKANELEYDQSIYVRQEVRATMDIVVTNAGAVTNTLTITINAVDVCDALVLAEAVPTKITTAQEIVDNINALSHGYTAVSDGVDTVTITAPVGSGFAANYYAGSDAETGILAVTTPGFMTGGQSTVEDLIAVFNLLTVTMTASGISRYVSPDKITDLTTTGTGTRIEVRSGKAVIESMDVDESAAAIITSINAQRTGKVKVINSKHFVNIHVETHVFEGQSGGVAVTLALIADAYKIQRFVNLTAQTVTLSPQAGTIGGQATITLVQYESVDIIPGGTIYGYSNHVVYVP